MHKSRLAGFIFDCRTDDLDEATRFWSAALGYAVRADQAESNYRELDADRDGLQVEVQAVQHPSRVHLDIETDDLEAEVERLEFIKRWWLMEAPTGQRFCVVPPQCAEFEQRATAWSQ